MGCWLVCPIDSCCQKASLRNLLEFYIVNEIVKNWSFSFKSAENKKSPSLEMEQAEQQFNRNIIKSAHMRSKGTCFKIYIPVSHSSWVSIRAIIFLQIGEEVVSPEQPSLRSGSGHDKITALSQAIAHEAKGHLRNDRAGMTDTGRSLSFLMFLPADTSAVIFSSSINLLHWDVPGSTGFFLGYNCCAVASFFGTTCVADP